MKSTESDSMNYNLTRVFDGFHSIALNVFNESVDQQGFKSFIPLPLDSPWYTALPWFTYFVLSNLNSRIIVSSPSLNKINIAELFTFGGQASNSIGNSFDIRPFSLLGGGYANCIFKNLVNTKALTYTIRYDQSRGQPLVHLDYSIYDGKTETKLINHLPLNLEAVYDFNEDLYIAITGAGLFDGYFTTCFSIPLVH